MENIKFARKFPKIWSHTEKNCLLPYSYEDGLDSFYDYCKDLWNALSLIDEFGRNEKKIFYVMSGKTVDSFIDILVKYFDKINNIIFDKDKYKNYKEQYKDHPYGFISNINSFCSGCTKHINKNICELDKNGHIISLKEEYYNKVSFLVDKIFAIERYCSKICKQIWKNELTEINNLNLKENYKIIVKHIYETGWRNDRHNDKIQGFLKTKKYQSASLISNKNHSHFFNYYKNQCSALLIYESDVSKIVCASQGDGYTEEFINGVNPCHDVQDYTDINKIETKIIGNNKHDIYIRSTMISTPNSILSNKSSFNEVLMREPKVVGVLAVDKNGKNFANNVAQQLNVPYYGVLNRQITTEEKFNSNFLLYD